jgi:metal-responsive CopG/Arc/MetJ family transcriptional regulator
MSKKIQISVSLEQEDIDGIEQYSRTRGLQRRPDAIRELIRIALQSANPQMQLPMPLEHIGKKQRML